MAEPERQEEARVMSRRARKELAERVSGPRGWRQSDLAMNDCMISVKGVDNGETTVFLPGHLLNKGCF